MAFKHILSIVDSPSDLCSRILALNVFKLFDTMIDMYQLCMGSR